MAFQLIPNGKRKARSPVEREFQCSFIFSGRKDCSEGGIPVEPQILPQSRRVAGIDKKKSCTGENRR
jgi:hypothetical protein